MVLAASDHPLRILHLEDSESDHFLARRVLQRSHLQVQLQRTESLAEFQQLVNEDTFDLILADYRLPGFTALDAWDLLSRISSAPPFVLLSGAIGEAAAVDALRHGIADYLLKDDMGRLPHIVERAVEMHRTRIEKANAEAELRASQKRLAELTEHLQSSIEQERAVIAREIHDDIGGSLTAVRFDVAWILRHSENIGIKQHAQAASEMLQHATEASQRIMMNLRPPVLEQGLVAAVQWLATNFERRTGVRAAVHSSAEHIAVSAEAQLAAYRTAQEALTNVSKYAEAQTVKIDIAHDDDVLTLEVRDDGKGIEPAMLLKPRSFGLKGLQERARSVGGWLDISSRPQEGTSVILTIPREAHSTLIEEQHP